MAQHGQNIAAALAQIQATVASAPQHLERDATAAERQVGDAALGVVTVGGEHLDPDEKTWKDMVRDVEYFLYHVLGGNPTLLQYAIAFAIRVPGLRTDRAPTPTERSRLGRLLRKKGAEVWEQMRNLCPEGFMMRLSAIVKVKRGELNRSMSRHISESPGSTLSNMVLQFGTQAGIPTDFITPAGPTAFHDAVAYFVEGFWIYKHNKKQLATKHNGGNPINLRRIMRFAFMNAADEAGTVTVVPPHLFNMCIAVIRAAASLEYIRDGAEFESAISAFMKPGDDGMDLSSVEFAK